MMAFGIGTEIAGYRVIRPIGEGGMSIVYLAERLADGGQAVIKVLRAELAATDDFRRRFLRESGYATSLDHPNVVSVYDAGEAEGVLYIAMQYVEGTDLHAFLLGGALEPEVASGILTQVGAALDAAHAIGLLHRDVKPGNVLVAAGPAGEQVPHCYLADFGLSKQVTKDSVALTQAGNFVGTIHYTAPEQMLGQELGVGVDVYALGCLLYECLSGEPPFAGGSDIEVMQAHFESPPPELSAKRPEAPKELDAVIAKAMAKEPGERYGSCGELVEAVRAAAGVGGEPVVEAGAGPAAGGAPPGKLKLKVTGGNAIGSEIEVEDEFLFGREAPGKGKLGDDIQISRRQAKISRSSQGEFAIEDLGSTNGTVVNGRQITAPEILSPGDTLELGGTKLVVEVSPPATPPVQEPEPEAPPEPIIEPAQPEEPAVEPEAAAPAAAPAASARLSLRLEIDLESGEASLKLDEGFEPVRLVHEDGRWRRVH